MYLGRMTAFYKSDWLDLSAGKTLALLLGQSQTKQ